MKITVKTIIMAFVPYGLIVIYRHLKENKKRIENSDDFEWLMTENEKELFKKYIHHAKIYLEFGSGGSTIAALKFSEGQIYSVESSNEWIKTLRQKNEIINNSEKSRRLNLIHADIGNVGMFGTPIVSENETNLERFLNYSQKIFSEYSKVKFADVILIDGRFRVACCLSTLLETNEDAVIILHDYWNRPGYHVIKNYVDIIDGVDTIMVCKKKQNISNDEIVREYEKYKYDYE